MRIFVRLFAQNSWKIVKNHQNYDFSRIDSVRIVLDNIAIARP